MRYDETRLKCVLPTGQCIDVDDTKTLDIDGIVVSEVEKEVQPGSA